METLDFGIVTIRFKAHPKTNDQMKISLIDKKNTLPQEQRRKRLNSVTPPLPWLQGTRQNPDSADSSEHNSINPVLSLHPSLEDHYEPLFQRRPKTIYPLVSELKEGTVTGKMRALLYDWMILVASEHLFTRDTYALAIYYMDSYTLAKNIIPRDQLQVIGFAAMTLAAKMEESKMPGNVPDLFTPQDISKYQLDICKTMNFFLNPDSYIYWAKLLMNSWDGYVQETLTEYIQCKYISNNHVSFTRSRQMYDILDCLTLHIASAGLDRQQLVLNVFFVLTRKNVEHVVFGTKVQDFLDKFYSNDTFALQFQQFAKVLGLGEFRPNKRLGRFVHRFLELKIDYSGSQVQTSSWNEFISIQTHNKDMYKYVKHLLDQ